MYISHPNVLPIIEISETPFPLCIMSPWMPGGNVAQYIKVNPGANRLTLVCVNQLENSLLTPPAIACSSVQRPDVPPRVGYLTR
jgi:serine/threonine protein kinase